MKAAVFENYGPPDVVRLDDVSQPQPRAEEVLIRVHATTVSTADWRIRSLTAPAGFGFALRLAFGWLRPRKPILGTELAGRIEAVGKHVSEFRIGDEVFACTGSARLGCHAEFAVVRASSLIEHIPRGMRFEEAAAISFGGLAALRFLRDKAKLQSGERVVVLGASGTVGSTAVQLAKYFGADVTGVTSTANVPIVRALGADRVIDYTQEDFTSESAQYDVIFDAVGATSFADCERVLRPKGRLLMLVAGLPEILRSLLARKRDGKRVLTGDAGGAREDMALLRDICVAGGYQPLIDHVYPLERIQEAHARVDSGRKKGSVVIRV